MAYVAPTSEKYFTITLRSDIAKDLDLQVLEISHPNRTPTILINMYNAPRQTGTYSYAADRLKHIPLLDDHPTIITGDWNLHHPWWRPSYQGSPSRLATSTAQWLNDKGMILMNEPDEPTHFPHQSESSPSTIDLTFINDLATTSDIIHNWAINPELSCASDHAAIQWTIDSDPTPVDTTPNKRWNFKKTDVTKFQECLIQSIATKPAITTVLSTPTHNLQIHDLEEATQGILDSLQEAADMSTPARKPSKHAKTWWSPDLTALRIEVQQSRSAARAYYKQHRTHNEDLENEATSARSRFKRKVRQTKRDSANERLAKATPKDVYKFRTWTKGKREYPSPPISRGEGLPLAIHHKDKCAALRKELFPAPPNLPHLQYPDLNIPRQNELPCRPITKNEVRNAIYHADPNNAPGPGGIPYLALRWAWESIEDELYALILACTSLGHHPAALRRAIAIALKKPRKNDYSNPRAYRLICLLETLSKVIERCQAGRLAYYAAKYHIISPNQFGGAPGKSTTDALLTFTHDIETAWTHGLVTSALTFDVTGAFDFVSHPYLLQTMWEKGIPTSIIKWTASFLSNRKAAISLDGRIEDMQTVETGVPQGSCISPILYAIAATAMFEITTDTFAQKQAPLPDNATLPTLIAFVDDGNLYVSSKSLDTNISLLQEGYTAINNWCRSVGFRLDPVKREIAHYTKARIKTKNLPSITLPSNNGIDTQTIRPEGSVKWIGVILDPKLTFRLHIQAMAAKAETALNCLKMLANTQRGLHQRLLRQLYTTCILPILTYASPTWWSNETVRGAKTTIKSMSKVQNAALRWICGCFKTTPIVALQIEAAIPPIEFKLNQLSTLAAIRLNKLDPNHPVLQRLGVEWRYGHQPRFAPPLLTRAILTKRNPNQSRLTILARLSNPLSERITPFQEPPWKRNPHDTDLKGRVTILPCPRGISKSDAAREHIAHISTIKNDPSHCLIYTDGSLLNSDHPRPKCGAGAVGYQLGQEAFELTVGMGPNCEVYDAELEGLASAAESINTLIFSSPPPNHIKTLHFFADNDAAIRFVFSGDANPGQTRAQRFRQSILWFLDRDPANKVEIKWTPGHQDLKGNDRADALAKRAADRVSAAPQTYTNARRQARSNSIRPWIEKWRSTPPEGGFATANRLPPSTIPPKHFLSLPRRIYSLVTQCRTGHSHTGEYYSTHVPSEEIHCPCGKYFQSRAHIIQECPRYESHRHILRKASRDIDLPTILGSKEGISALADFIEHTGAFTKSGSLTA